MTDPILRAIPGVLVALAIVCVVAALRPPVPRGGGGLAWARDWWSAVRERTRVARTVAAVLAGGVAWAGTGWPVAGAATAAGVAVRGHLLARRDAQAAIDRLEALASWTRQLANKLASGTGGLEQAIAKAARTPPTAIAAPVSALAVRVRTRGPEPALRMFADELADPAADEVTAALILRIRTGGRGLVDVLESKADFLAAAAADRRDVEADRAKPRTDARLVISITAIVLAGLVLFSRDYLDPFTGMVGQLVMAAIITHMGMAYWWMHLLSKHQTKLRLLGVSDASQTVGARR